MHSRQRINSSTSATRLNVSWDGGPFRDLFDDYGWNSETFFLECLNENRTDDEINPLEDAIITHMYMVQGQTLQEMSTYLNRSERAINLRIRILFDLLGSDPSIYSISDKIEIAKFFRKRAEKYLDFCRRVIIASNPEHEVALLDDGEYLLREALNVFLDVPEHNHSL
jgi:hypothetical protein